MSELNRVETHFGAGGESAELEGYRPISPLVILACLTGLASILAVTHPLLWTLPVVAAVLSACAILQVSNAQSRYSGRLAAIGALCLATLVGAYAPARAISYEHQLYARAEPKAREWISLIQQQRYQEAHQFSLGPLERFDGPGTLADFYHAPVDQEEPDQDPAIDASAPVGMNKEKTAGERLSDFLQEPLIAELVEFDQQGTITHLENVSIGNTYGNIEMTQRFRLSGLRNGQPESLEFLVVSARWETPGRADWQFRDYRVAE